MHRLRRAAVLVAALSTVGLATAGTAYAGGEGGHEHGDMQSSQCKDHDLNLDVLGEVGILNGLLGNALNGEGDPGAQGTHIGSTMGCNNSAD
ncbi:hypothetical protein [Streptomyces roseochromogenus]|uniref:Chaplin domain-containing protein n=1 Tax=Streptomyces roseochromogenus subsp. oscitans DS 12.976 TaxID=1352936 RepID=V6KQT0_STRRC|nr:hypothetical protein [Streptomyces roseochromogenus]EST34540.1 hypothetical protein M878_09775 [Streptomyces roseochromogenus subsp. oscitans DS 12.976]